MTASKQSQDGTAEPFLFNNQPDALINQIYLLCPSSGVFYCTFGTGKFHAECTVENS